MHNWQIDFIGDKEAKQDYSAIIIKFYNGEKEILGVYDGGFKSTGEAIFERLDKYYKTKHLDFIICSHPHRDHDSGLEVLLENCTVDKLYMNLPWDCTKEFVERGLDDGLNKILTWGMSNDLREKFPYINSLEKIAKDKCVLICEIFTGQVIENGLYVLSPSDCFYSKMVKSTFENESVSSHKESDGYTVEDWKTETLKEDVETDPENEMSVVLYGVAENHSFLLTGDAGVRNLNCAINYATSIGISLKDSVSLYQIPHHGSRHNVTPNLLNKMIGDIKPENCFSNKIAVACVGSDSDHPRKIVSNAFIRRGVKVYTTKTGTVSFCYKNNDVKPMENSYDKVSFSKQVEKWSDS